LTISRIPLALWLAAIVAAVKGRRRSPADDARILWNSLRPEPRILGEKHVPLQGPLLVAVNHYNGPGICVGFTACLVAHTTHQLRSAAPIGALGTTHYERARVFGLRVSVPRVLTEPFFRRAYASYGVIPMPRRSDSGMQRAASLRSMLAALSKGHTFIFFPEGANERNFALRRIPPGAGNLLQLVAKRGVPTIVAVVFEVDGRFVVSFGDLRGPAEVLAMRAPADDIGAEMARSLPFGMRGAYASLRP
jgi:Acyltransferase